MARNPDRRAGDFETENTGGFLTGFLAEEDDFDRRSLWRLGSWGAASVATVIVALLANQSSIGLRREQAASTDLTQQSQQIQSLARQSQNETRRLASAVDTLNGDRDRLYSRITVLEQGLDSVTGAIARQNSAAASPAVAATSATPEPQSTPQNPVPAPVVAPVTTTSATKTSTPPTEKVSAAAPPTEKVSASTPPAEKVSAAAPPVEKPSAAAPPAEKPSAASVVAEPGLAMISPAEKISASTPAATPAVPLIAPKSLMAPPDSAAAKLTEPEARASAITSAPIPEVAAAAPLADKAAPDASEATSPKVAVQRTEFGLDVGGANSIDGLRALWRGLLKSKANTALVPLRPIIVLKEHSNDRGMQLRLVVGPLYDAAAAAKICVALVERGQACETTVFDGQRLAMKADEQPPAAAKPVMRRRGIAKRAATEASPNRPDTAMLSSLVGKN